MSSRVGTVPRRVGPGAPHKLTQLNVASSTSGNGDLPDVPEDISLETVRQMRAREPVVEARLSLTRGRRRMRHSPVSVLGQAGGVRERCGAQRGGVHRCCTRVWLGRRCSGPANHRLVRPYGCTRHVLARHAVHVHMCVAIVIACRVLVNARAAESKALQAMDLTDVVRTQCRTPCTPTRTRLRRH